LSEACPSLFSWSNIFCSPSICFFSCASTWQGERYTDTSEHGDAQCTCRMPRGNAGPPHIPHFCKELESIMEGCGAWGECPCEPRPASPTTHLPFPSDSIILSHRQWPQFLRGPATAFVPLSLHCGAAPGWPVAPASSSFSARPAAPSSPSHCPAIHRRHHDGVGSESSASTLSASAWASAAHLSSHTPSASSEPSQQSHTPSPTRPLSTNLGR
jgi:hypothetical protein